MTTKDEMEAYVDGLVTVGIIEDLDHDRYIISKKWYNEGRKMIKDVRKTNPQESPLDVFNMAMVEAMKKRLGYVVGREELDMYFKALMSCFASSGIYDQLFPDWQAELGIDFE